MKLDGTYVSGLGERSTDEAIVRHVASLARALGIAAVAEGVQDAKQVERLLEIGCELGQGYFFSDPQPPTIIGSLLHRQYEGSASESPPPTPSPATRSLGAPAPAEEEAAPVVLPKLRQTTPVAPD